MNRANLIACAFAFAALLMPAVAQDTKPEATKPASTETSAASLPKPAAAWPALAAKDRDRAIALTGQFKKDDEAIKQAARAELLAMGAGAAPVLFQKVGDADKELALNEELFTVFDSMLTAEHRVLMADQAKKKKIELRKYLLRRLCTMADAELKSAFEPFRKDGDEQVGFYANLGLASMRDKDALLDLLERTRSDWAAHVDMVKQALPAARSSECATAVIEHMAKQGSEVKAAGLRLLRYVATDAEKPTIKVFLGSEEHGIVKEAVNALRVMHGQEPLEKLSAFDAIGMAKEWQGK